MRRGARLALAGALTLAAGCSVSTEREVYLKMPVSRLELPEQPARRMSSGPGVAAFERVTLTADQTTTPPDPQAPQFAHDDEELQVRLDGALTPFVSVAGKLYGEGLGLVQLKALPLAGLAGRGPFSLAVTAGYGKSVTEEGEDFLYNADSDQYARTTLKSSLADYGLILGWRLSEQVLVFGGPFRSRLKYSGHYFSARGSDPDVEQDFAGEVTQSGANLGLALNPSRWATVLLEYASANLEGGRAEADTGRFAASVEFSFGSLLRPPPPADEEPPVEVVPPTEERDASR